VFSRGWLPGWLDRHKPGVAADIDIKLTLRGVAMNRWRPVSGWDLEAKHPKAIRRLAPAGSVYFFEAKGETAEFVERAWLAPVSDDEQAGRDGFGLAVWGIW